MIEGVIFDVDGVLIDSEPFIGQAAVRMFAEHNIAVTLEDFIPFVGAGEDRYLGGVAEKYRFPLNLERDKTRTYDIYAELVKGRLKPLPGVHAFIGRCKKLGLRLALATSADKVKLIVNLKEIGIQQETFDAVVSGLEVKKKKPDPEIFITAARRMDLLPSKCLVVEDAVNGVIAAKSAGARCLALTTSFSPGQLSGADWIAPNLAQVPEEVVTW